MADIKDDECFMAVAEGLAALSMLKSLKLSGFCVQVTLFCHYI
jgi:hypothetical protein